MVNFLKHYSLCNTSIKKARKGLMAKEITLQDDNQTYEEHQNGNFINNMHRLQVDVFRSVGILFPKEITSYFAQAKEFPEPIFILFFLLHTLKVFDQFGINPVTVFLNKADQFINGLFGRNVLFNNIFASV
jgi:hypothetical protein